MKMLLFEAKREGQRSLGTWVLRTADDLDRAIQLAYAEGILPEISSAHYAVAPAPAAAAAVLAGSDYSDSFPRLDEDEDQEEEMEF